MKLLLLMLGLFAHLAGGGPGEQRTVLVALGDSFSSGEGAKHYYEETDRRGNRCHRSRRAWPLRLGASRTYLLACSGAETAQLYVGARRRDSEGQLSGLRRTVEGRRVDVVTVTIGGNDIGFAGHVRNCFLLPSLCLRDEEAIDRSLGVLRGELQRGYRAIVAAAGGVRLVVVGYPEITPEPSEPDRCIWLSRIEKERAARIALKLDRTVAEAADAAGVEFVSVRDALDEHELCTDDPWLRPVGRLFVAVQEMGHPNERGQEAIADAVRERVLPAP